MKCRLFVVLALMSAAISAQSVHKCVATNGSISYQSEPCDAAATVKKTWDAVPEQLGTAEQSQRYTAQQKAADDAAYLRRLAHGNSGVARHSAASMDGIPKQSNACSRARKQRDAFYAKSPKRSSKDMERWNMHVYDTCKKPARRRLGAHPVLVASAEWTGTRVVMCLQKMLSIGPPTWSPKPPLLVPAVIGSGLPRYDFFCGRER